MKPKVIRFPAERSSLPSDPDGIVKAIYDQELRKFSGDMEKLVADWSALVDGLDPPDREFSEGEGTES